MAHSSLPFHSIEEWTGEFFKKISLNSEGFILYLGHGGLCCPANTSPTEPEAAKGGKPEAAKGGKPEAAKDGKPEAAKDGKPEAAKDTKPEAAKDTKPEAAGEGEHDVVDEILLEAWEPRDKRTLVVVDVSGVHQLVVGWCCCKDAPDHATQLFEHDLFPASTSQPSTAFSFAVLEYFHVDAVECKTSAFNFFNKLRRLTSFSSPQSVPVSKLIWFLEICLMYPRIDIVN